VTGNRRVDYPLLLAVLSLAGLGVAIVYSASAVRAGMDTRLGDWEYFFHRQLVFALAGAALLFVFAKIPYTYWRDKAALCTLGTLLMLGAVLVFGNSANGAQRWLAIAGQSVQPSEFAKFAVALYLASYLARKGEELREHPGRAVRPLMVVGLIAALIFAERDLGTTVFVFLLAFGLLFAAGARMRVLAAGAVALALLAGVAIASTPYRRERMAHFVDSLAGRGAALEEKRELTQVDQSLAAFANGGVLGKGMGMGDSKRMFLPEAHTDFILAVVGEEMGAAGVIAVLGLFAIIVWRGFSIAQSAPDPFACLLAAGITLVIGLGALLNAMMVTGLLPPKGIALPLVSYGGSSLIASMVGTGVLLNIAGRRVSA
jgi:cell division protein FtsW